MRYRSSPLRHEGNFILLGDVRRTLYDPFFTKVSNGIAVYYHFHACGAVGNLDVRGSRAWNPTFPGSRFVAAYTSVDSRLRTGISIHFGGSVDRGRHLALPRKTTLDTAVFFDTKNRKYKVYSNGFDRDDDGGISEDLSTNLGGDMVYEGPTKPSLVQRFTENFHSAWRAFVGFVEQVEAVLP